MTPMDRHLLSSAMQKLKAGDVFSITPDEKEVLDHFGSSRDQAMYVKAMTAPAPAPPPAPATASRPVTQQVLEKGMEAFTQLLDAKLRAAFKERDQQIADLQSRLQQSEGALADQQAKNAVLDMEAAADKAAQGVVYRGY